MGAAEKWDVPRIDLVTAGHFLERLGSTFTFQTLDDSGDGRGHLVRVLHGTLAQYCQTLTKLNQQGAGVFVMVNAGNGKGRRVENVVAVRALFADLDGAPLEPVLAADLAPHAIIQSSPGRWHAYWLVDEVPLEQFRPFQQALASRFTSDPTVCDLPRVMRVPGFLHNKREPFLSRILKQHDQPPYSRAAVAGWLGAGDAPNAVPAHARRSPAQTLPETIAQGERNSTLLSLAGGLVNRGHSATGVSSRLQTINVKRCQPPLCASEVDTIAARATAYGSKGFVNLPHALLDSPAWKALPSASCAIVLAFYRRFNGFNNGYLSVPWSDFADQHGISTSRRFYTYLGRAVSAGLLIKTAASRNTQSGRIPAMYAIPDEYLPKCQNSTSGHVSEQRT